MDIKYGKQINISDIQDKNISLFLFARNHEERVFTAYNKLIDEKVNLEKTIGFCYNDEFISNDDRKINYTKISSHNEITSLLDQHLVEKSEINIAIDYSCMTKSWYYTIILYFKKRDLKYDLATIYFIYTPSKFTKPLEPKFNTEIAPLPGKFRVSTDKPKALIVCLGYEQNKAEGIIDHLDPKKSYLFYSNPALDEKFVAVIEKNNENLLKKTERSTTFPLDNLLSIERELTSLYFQLKDDFSIIIAPLGPKPFTLISMLMTIKYPDIDIWRVGSGSDINKYIREPIDNDTFIVSEVVFEQLN